LSGVDLSNVYEVQLVAIYTYIIYTCLVFNLMEGVQEVSIYT
jgi:hypothetical protein